jgi:hypothetical protein
VRHAKHSLFPVIWQFISDRLNVDKAAPGPVSIATRRVIFNGSCSRRRVLMPRFVKPGLPLNSQPGHKIERPAAIIVFGREADARDNANASGTAPQARFP